VSASSLHQRRIEALLQKGKVQEAIHLAERVARTHSRDADLVLALAHVMHSAGLYDATRLLCECVLESRPTIVPALLYHAIALTALGHPKRALQSLEAALRQHPNAWELLVNKGMALEACARDHEARECYEQALKFHPDCVEALNNLGNVLQRLHCNEEALTAYTEALNRRPGYTLALYNRGTVENRLGRFSQALADFDLVLRIQPEFVHAWSDRGIALAFLGRFEEALASCDRALALAPAFGKAFVNRGIVLNQLGRFSEALEAFASGENHLGETVEVLNGRAQALRGTGRLRESLACHDRSVELDPSHVQTHVDRGVVLAELGETRCAINAYDIALGLDETCADARFNKCLLELGSGGFDSGWRGYEQRWNRRGAEPRMYQQIRQWNGESLAGTECLLVWSEQGVGDELLFASLYPDLEPFGSRCVIECRAKLIQLFRRSFPWATFVARDSLELKEALKKVTHQIPAGSLARFFRRSLGDFPQRGGYLYADPDRLGHWRQRLSERPGLKVGFSWRSSNTLGDRALSCMQLCEWDALFATPAVQWICLQYDDCAAELEKARQQHGNELLRFDAVDYYDDLDEVGALISALDLVITAPTSVSMQAAAHGVETWHLSYGPEWQMHGTPGFPWLPKLHRFERRWDETWHCVLGRVAERLRVNTRDA